MRSCPKQFLNDLGDVCKAQECLPFSISLNCVAIELGFSSEVVDLEPSEERTLEVHDAIFGPTNQHGFIHINWQHVKKLPVEDG
jgi:hypothetical protein